MFGTGTGLFSQFGAPDEPTPQPWRMTKLTGGVIFRAQPEMRVTYLSVNIVFRALDRTDVTKITGAIFVKPSA